jgi:hypothetical protein
MAVNRRRNWSTPPPEIFGRRGGRFRFLLKLLLFFFERGLLLV